ncbi:SGNH/GDSL hydrolase family protein [Flavicella sp.]|uniref:SGNH/GDSL hydrolase family protein n=1 Tax=Flavicella sp. TaxID=2957742 RepID=UPI0030183331
MNRREFVKYLGATSIYIGAVSCASTGVFRKKHNEEICREAWKSIANKGEAFNYVTPDKSLPNVFIYGDSISIGYTSTVRERLLGKANVFRFYKNGQSSDKFISFMDKMKKTMFQPYLKEGWKFDWDVIHFNVGLHDLKYVKKGKLDKINGKQVNRIEVYKTNIDKICIYLMQEFPKAKLIFATTTAVPEGAKGRFVGDSIKYNKAAREVLTKYPSIGVNDLYGFTKSNSSDWYIKQGNVHYNSLGKLNQGKQVEKVIAENL